MNISKKDILELRRRMTKKGCTIDYFGGCYVGGNKNIILKFTESFTDLEEDAFFKYLEIAKKVLSSSLGANLLELQFQKNETGTEHQRFLYALKASKLENEEMIDRLYEKIIDTYSYVGNYLILLFHDVYDIPARSKDRKKLDESVETYEYLICAICPVDFSKSDLGYDEGDNAMTMMERNWVVGSPDLGFVYPAFANHGADASAVMYFVKTGKDSHLEVIEDVVGCIGQRTAGEEKNAFRDLIENSFEDPQQGESVFLKVQKRLSDLTLPDPDALPSEEEEEPPMTLTPETFSEVVTSVDMPEEAREILVEAFELEFKEQLPTAQNVVDKKLVEESVQRIRTAELETQVVDLKEKLDDKEKSLAEVRKTVKELESASPMTTAGDHEISLHVSPAKAQQIYTQSIGGKKCIVIPVERDESTSINGVPTAL